MDKTAAIVCHAFLQKCSSEQRNALIRYLPPSEAQQISALPETLGNPTKGFGPLGTLLDRVHYSWLEPTVRTLPKAEIRLFLSCLNEVQIKGLKQQLLFSNHLPTLPLFVQTYFRETLFEKIADPDLLPIPCLPVDRLNILLELEYSEFLSLIDLLAMHDLAIEVRHIIDTVKLKQIQALLTKPQHTYLKTLSYKKEPVAFKKIGLNNWDSDTEALQTILHQRGINRLAKALYECHPSLIWYVVHSLDSERGEMLKQLCAPLDHPRATAILTDQVVDLVESMNNINPA